MPSRDDGGPWLHAWFDPLANLKTVTSCVRLADLSGGELLLIVRSLDVSSSDGENKLIICNQDKRMLVYRGTVLMQEVILLEVPVALCVTYMDNASV